jgi:multidrug efflux pump subunit AcrA (membrane-fusion protein)
MAKPNSPSPHLILQTLKNRWRLVLSWTLFFLVLAGGLFWLGHEDKRIRPAIPPTVNDNTITFSSRPDGIRTEAVDAAGVVETGYPGRLVWAEDRTSRIRSPFNGRIVRGLVKVGDRVQAGQPLAEIQSSDYARAEADYQLADANLQRAATLYQAGIVSKRELQVAEGEYRRAKAEFMRSQPAGAEPSLSAAGAYFLLRSPISGVVAEMSINPGQEIRADQDSVAPLFLVTDPAQLWIWIDLGELDLQQLQPFRLPFAVTISSIAFRDQGFRGEVVQFRSHSIPQRALFGSGASFKIRPDNSREKCMSPSVFQLG